MFWHIDDELQTIALQIFLLISALNLTYQISVDEPWLCGDGRKRYSEVMRSYVRSPGTQSSVHGSLSNRRLLQRSLGSGHFLCSSAFFSATFISLTVSMSGFLILLTILHSQNKSIYKARMDKSVIPPLVSFGVPLILVSVMPRRVFTT